MGSRSSSIEEADGDGTLEGRYNERLKQLYDLEPQEDIVPTKGQIDDGEHVSAEVPVDENEESYNFRLFAKNVQSAQPVPSQNPSESLQKIVLRSPSPANSEPGFVNPRRPEEYYFTGVLNVEQAECFRQSAVSGEHILEGLGKSWVCPQGINFGRISC